MIRWFAVAVVVGSLPAARATAEVTVEKTPEGVTVKADGQPFTTYITKSGSKPILWPVIGPTGKRMTRNWPMEQDVKGETDRDHIHQRSLWFTHGSVNGVDFWSEGKGRIEHREFVKVDGSSYSRSLTPAAASAGSCFRTSSGIFGGRLDGRAGIRASFCRAG